MSKFVTRFLKDESGATAIEYGLIAALIAVVLVTALTRLTPPEQTGACFGAYAVSGVATAWLAPTLVTVATRATHSQQGGFAAIVACCC